ncbi:conserved hypothetical protein [Gammaproteobacteria bacterium]
METKIRPVTKEEQDTWPKTVIVPLEKPFTDERGSIQPLMNVAMESCVLISSKKGTVRANHYHRTDWHYCYVLEGEIEYWERPTGTTDPAVKTVIGPGTMFFTGPSQDHAMVFTKDTTFLTFGRNSRAHEVYEADVVRIPPLASPY